MSKFCKYCGSKLEDQQICSCDRATNERAQQNLAYTTPQQTPSQQQSAPIHTPPTQPDGSQTPPPQVAPYSPPPQQSAPYTSTQPATPQTQPLQQGPTQYTQPSSLGSPYTTPPQQGSPYTNVPPHQGNAKAEQYKKQALEMLSDFSKLFISTVKAPVTTGKEFVINGKNPTAYLIMGLQAILLGIIAVSITSSFNSIIDSMLGGVESLLSFSDEIGAMVNAIKFNLFTAFFLSVVLFTGLSFAFAGILLACIKVFKGESSFSQCLRLTAMHGIPNLVVGVLILISFLIGFTDIIVGLVFFALICTFAFTISLLPFTTTSDLNKQFYIALIAELVAIVVIGIVLNLLLPYYLPETIRGYLGVISGQLESLKEGGVAAILEEIL